MPKSDLRLGDGDYSPVAERIRLFYDRYPTGRIVTHLVRHTDADVTFRAEVFRTPGERDPAATGWAAERVGDGEVNAVACLENTETSAIGRALANLGLTASRHRPSREEMEKAARARVRLRRATSASGLARSARSDDHPRPNDGDVQRRAALATDVLTLLNRAARLGLSDGKVAVFRDAVTCVEADDRLLARAERRLRDWLDHRMDRMRWER
jgi:hypothetical protein